MSGGKGSPREGWSIAVVAALRLQRLASTTGMKDGAGTKKEGVSTGVTAVEEDEGAEDSRRSDVMSTATVRGGAHCHCRCPFALDYT